MKKIQLMVVLFVTFSGVVNAQITNTKWKGQLKLDNTVNVTFDFAKDTLTVMNLDENSVLETMTFSAVNSTLVLHNVSGLSECDNATTGKYKYQIENDLLLITLVDDSCNDRSSALKEVKLTRVTL